MSGTYQTIIQQWSQFQRINSESYGCRIEVHVIVL